MEEEYNELLKAIYQLTPKQRKELIIELMIKDVAEKLEIEPAKIPRLIAEEAIDSVIRWTNHWTSLKKQK